MARRNGATHRVTEVDWTSEHFTYRSVWNAAIQLREAGDRDRDHEHWFSSQLAALVLTYTAYEGFLNHVIETLYPEVWQKERSFFRTQPYEGTLGKTKFLADRLGMALHRAARPYRTVAELHSWRNDLVHPRTVRGAGVRRADAYARKPNRVQPVSFRKLGQDGFVDRCFDDAAALADALLDAAVQGHTPGARELSKLGSFAFWGPFALGGGSLKR